MKLSSALRVVAAATLLCLACGVARAQAPAYPSKPIRFILFYASGGPAEVRGRLIAQAVGAQLGQPLVVEFFGGGGGAVGAALVSRAPKDGYTIGVTGISAFALAPLIFDKPPFEDKDLDFLALLTNSPEMIVTVPKTGLGSLQDVVKEARANPGKVNFGSAGAASITRLGLELLKAEAKIDMLHVPYKGIGPAITDLLGGRVQLILADAVGVQQYISSGQMKPIAVTSAKRLPVFPDVPTTAEAGFPRVLSDNYSGLVGPAGLPAAIPARIAQAVKSALGAPDLVQQFAKQAMVAMPGTGDEARKIMLDERARWAPIVKANNITAD
jgi:tripartite-type tricarboxylate transporter receptor subunit TctC